MTSESPQQKWRPIDNREKLQLSQNSAFRKTHSQPNVQGAEFECGKAIHSGTTFFQKQWQKPIHHEYQHDSQNRTDMRRQRSFQVEHHLSNVPMRFRSHSNEQKHPSQQQHNHADSRQNHQLQQDATMSARERLTHHKAHSRLNYEVTTYIIDGHQELLNVDHKTVSNTEDPALREEFPDVDGHLFEVWLKKGKTGGLGLSIVANTTGQALPGIIIMGIQKGGAAEKNGEIKWGDMILKVNDTCVIGMSQTQVQEFVANTSPNVRFVLVRQYGNSATARGGGRGGGEGETKEKVYRLCPSHAI